MNREQLIFIIVLASCNLTFLRTASAESVGDVPTFAKDKPLLADYSGAGDSTIANCTRTGVRILYPSVDWSTPNDFLKAWVESCHRRGLEVYPSLASAEDGYENRKSQFAMAHPQYWEKRRNGTLINSGVEVGLSFGYPEVRAYKVQAMAQLVRTSGVDGVLLDYTRFFGNDAGYCDAIVRDFRQQTGRDPFNIPNEDLQWVKFRAGYVTKFVTELRSALNQISPGIKIIACVGPDPDACLKNNLQDWRGWLDAGLIDGVTAMIYERDTNNTIKQIKIAQQAIRQRVPFIALIACWGGNLNTSALLREGTFKSFQAGADGVGYYREDAINDLDLWDTIGQIGHMSVHDIRNTPTNYILNSSFESGLEDWAIGAGNGIAVSTDHGRSGPNCLHFTFPTDGAVRQIINRCWIGSGKSVHLSGFVDASKMPPDGKLAVELREVYEDGTQQTFRVPLKLESVTGWQPFAANVSLRGTTDLKFFIVGILASADRGSCDVDDLSLELSAENVDSSDFIQPDATRALASPAGQNIVLGQLVSCSSFWENGFEGFHAVDGNLSSDNYGKGADWQSQRPAKNQWIKIYLPSIELISRIRLLNASAQSAYRTREYKIELSTDDRIYSEVAHGIMPDDSTTWTEVKIAPRAAAYIRFTGVIGYNPDYAIGLKEIQVYGPSVARR
jgi:hypothetical protein